ncbi:MAG: hypothetical protein V7642_1224 [Burkholderiales bacterium]|jgi:hypothetical protein
MSSQLDAISLILVLLVFANVAGIGTYALAKRFRAWRRKKNAAVIAQAIAGYFSRSGVGVSVECTRVPRSQGFIATIESEPMKRFRLSHIIESTLREHVRKTCGFEVEKVYWRFPIKDAAQDGAAPPPNPDEYINEGLEHYRHIPKTEVTELPWEHFEKMSVADQEKKAAARETQLIQ